MPDQRVQAALDHWAPRFVQAGVDANDFTSVTRRIETWEEWIGAWSENGDMHAAIAAEASGAGRTRSAGEAWARAAVAYHFAKFVWVLDPARSRAAADSSVAALRSAHECLDPTAERIEVALDGGNVVGNLRRPDGDRPPLVLLVPGLDSTKEEFLRLEDGFLARGMATFSIDGPGQGECGYDLPIRPDYEVATGVVLDALAGRSDLDTDRIGLLGVSMGGYYAARVAAFEPRVKAAVGISGPYDFGAIWDELPGLTRETFVAKSFARDEEEGRVRASELSLAGVAERIRQPFLAITGKLDRLIPWRHTERAAAEAPDGSFVCFEDGNHVCANVPYRARPLAADWLRERLG